MWPGHQWRRLRGWYAQLSRPRRAIILAVVFTSPCWCCFGGGSLNGLHNYWFVFTPEDRDFLRNDRSGYAEGLPSAGRRLKTEMEDIPDPETAIQLHPDWTTIQFPNGEWLFGYGINSHGFKPGHGTLVVKDSQGKVRIFFGHVCGENGPLLFGGSPNDGRLDDYYSRLKEGSLREWNPDPQ